MGNRIPWQSLILFLGIAGCASGPVISPLEEGETEAIGHYAIPKAIVDIELELTYPKDALTDASKLSVGAVSMKITSLETQYVLAANLPIHYKRRANSTDKITLGIDASGFLTEVSVDSEEDTAELVETLFDIATSGKKLAEVPPAFTFVIDGPTVTQTLNLLLDPYRDNRQVELIPGLANSALTVRVEGYGSAIAKQSKTQQSDIKKECNGKICYPVLVSRKLEFSGPGGTTASRIIVVPDPEQLVLIDFERAAAVKKAVKATFSNGMLTKLELSKPSQGAAIAAVPFNILSDIISLPAEIVQLKIDTTNKEKDLLNAQKDLLDSQQALLEALEKKADSMPSDNGTGSY